MKFTIGRKVWVLSIVVCNFKVHSNHAADPAISDPRHPDPYSGIAEYRRHL
jgi:hypothetical protein